MTSPRPLLKSQIDGMRALRDRAYRLAGELALELEGSRSESAPRAWLHERRVPERGRVDVVDLRGIISWADRELDMYQGEGPVFTALGDLAVEATNLLRWIEQGVA